MNRACGRIKFRHLLSFYIFEINMTLLTIILRDVDVKYARERVTISEGEILTVTGMISID